MRGINWQKYLDSLSEKITIRQILGICSISHQDNSNDEITHKKLIRQHPNEDNMSMEPKLADMGIGYVGTYNLVILYGFSGDIGTENLEPFKLIHESDTLPIWLSFIQNPDIRTFSIF